MQVTQTFSELLTDNAELLLNAEHVNEQFVQHITRCMHHQHSSELAGANFANTLRIICSLHGKPLAFAQCLVLDHCIRHLLNRSDNPIPKISISSDGSVQISSNMHSSGLIDVSTFREHDHHKPLEQCNPAEATYRFHLEVLRLIAELRRGRNVYTIEYLFGNREFFGLDFDLLLKASTNRQLPKLYRSYLLTLLTQLFVECEPNTEVRFLNPILLSKSSDACGHPQPNNRQPVVMKSAFTNFPQLRPDMKYTELKSVCLAMCSDEGRFDSNSGDCNALINSLLFVLGKLLKYGKFTQTGDQTSQETNPELLRLIQMLVKLLSVSGNCE